MQMRYNIQIWTRTRWSSLESSFNTGWLLLIIGAIDRNEGNMQTPFQFHFKFWKYR